MVDDAHHHEIADGSKTSLLAALDAARAELLAAAFLVNDRDRTLRPVCGHWMLKDLLGHIADWEAFGALSLGHMAEGQSPQVEYIHDIDTWNQDQVLAHACESWEETISRLNRAHHALKSQLERMAKADLDRSFSMPWGGEGTPRDWVSIYVRHDLEHTRDIESSPPSAT